MVRAGQPLARLQSDDLADKLVLAQSQLAQAQTKLKQLSDGAAPQDPPSAPPASSRSTRYATNDGNSSLGRELDHDAGARGRRDDCQSNLAHDCASEPRWPAGAGATFQRLRSACAGDSCRRHDSERDLHHHHERCGLCGVLHRQAESSASTGRPVLASIYRAMRPTYPSIGWSAPIASTEESPSATAARRRTQLAHSFCPASTSDT
jgi:hypothetical protein